MPATVQAVGNLALAVALLVLVVNGGFYVWRAHLLRALPACDAVDQLGVVHATVAFVKECMALAAAVLSIPFGWSLSRRRSARGTRGPLILVHGWGLNAGSLWCLRRRLLHDGWGPVVCFDHGLGASRTCGMDVEGAAAALRQMIQEVAPGNQPRTLIGYGAGGLVLRYCVRRYPIPTVRRIVTIGTPHFGTVVAKVGQWRDTLAPGAPLLNKLNAVDHLPQHSTSSPSIPPSMRWCCPEQRRYPGAFNIQVNDVGHDRIAVLVAKCTNCSRRIWRRR